MNRKNGFAILCTILMLVAMGLGVSIIYSDYLYNPTGGLGSIQVRSGREPGTPSMHDASGSALLQKVGQWAQEEQVTVLFKDATTAGCGFYGYSDWMQRNIGVETPNHQGVLIADDPAIREAYVSGDVFLPGRGGLEIQGMYHGSDLPPILEGVDFLYPLSIGAGAEGMYFTDAKDLQKLASLFEEQGYSVWVSRQTEAMSLWQLPGRLIADGFLSRAVLCAMLGLTFCFVYTIAMLYKDNGRRLWIHCIFGLSKKRMVAAILLQMAGTILTAALLFYGLLARGLTYMSPGDIHRILVGTLCIYTVLTLLGNGLGVLSLSRWFRLRGE